MKISRNQFIKTAGLAGIAGSLGLPPDVLAASNPESSLNREESKGLTFLFQGDSITDGNRSRNNDWNHVMGHGYAYLIACRLWFEYVNQDLMFYNRGISGNTIKDLDDRWQQDTLDLKPEVLSILIGVNDSHKIVAETYTLEDWKDSYIQVLDRTKKALPETRIVLCEPFILPYKGKEPVRKTWSKELAESYQYVISEMQVVVRQLAAVHKCLFIELQEAFENACKKAPAQYWIWDGIHPMPAGHELIARQWIDGVKEELQFLSE